MPQPTQLDRIESMLKRILAALQTVSTKETAIMSEQDQVDAMTAEELASVSSEEKFRADVEAFIAANPGAPNISALQAAVDSNKQEAASQTASDPSNPTG